MLVLVLILNAEEAGDVVKGPIIVDTPVVGLMLATKIDAGVEVVILNIISSLPLLAPTEPQCAPRSQPHLSPARDP